MTPLALKLCRVSAQDLSSVPRLFGHLRSMGWSEEDVAGLPDALREARWNLVKAGTRDALKQVKRLDRIAHRLSIDVGGML